MPQKNTCARPGCTRAVARNTTDTYQGLCFQHAKAAGYAHNYIPWEQAHPHLERLLNGGWTINEIAFHSGVSNSTLAGIQKHRRERFKYASVQALKQLPDNSPTRRPAWPLRRRINALRAIGIQLATISKDTGLSAGQVFNIASGRLKWVAISTDTLIRDYYQQHCMDPQLPIDVKTQKMRLTRPVEWDDIDDPNEVHYGAPPVLNPQRRNMVTAQTRHRLKTIVEHYGTIREAAKVLHMSNTDIVAILNGSKQKIMQRVVGRINYRYKHLPALPNQKAA
ncbi:hypothetical protein AZH46_04175 [Corynebacterium striatum]|nr:hypothetical protein AZH46_04175 [Corynebacterium striatum]